MNENLRLQLEREGQIAFKIHARTPEEAGYGLYWSPGKLREGAEGKGRPFLVHLQRKDRNLSVYLIPSEKAEELSDEYAHPGTTHEMKNRPEVLDPYLVFQGSVPDLYQREFENCKTGREKGKVTEIFGKDIGRLVLEFLGFSVEWSTGKGIDGVATRRQALQR